MKNGRLTPSPLLGSPIDSKKKSINLSRILLYSLSLPIRNSQRNGNRGEFGMGGRGIFSNFFFLFILHEKFGDGRECRGGGIDPPLRGGRKGGLMLENRGWPLYSLESHPNSEVLLQSPNFLSRSPGRKRKKNCVGWGGEYQKISIAHPSPRLYGRSLRGYSPPIKGLHPPGPLGSGQIRQDEWVQWWRSTRTMQDGSVGNEFQEEANEKKGRKKKKEWKKKRRRKMWRKKKIKEGDKQ